MGIKYSKVDTPITREVQRLEFQVARIQGFVRGRIEALKHRGETADEAYRSIIDFLSAETGWEGGHRDERFSGQTAIVNVVRPPLDGKAWDDRGHVLWMDKGPIQLYLDGDWPWICDELGDLPDKPGLYLWSGDVWFTVPHGPEGEYDAGAEGTFTSIDMHPGAEDEVDGVAVLRELEGSGYEIITVDVNKLVTLDERGIDRLDAVFHLRRKAQ